MKIAFISCFYPYRGGIAQFSDCLTEALREYMAPPPSERDLRIPDIVYVDELYPKDEDDIANQPEAIEVRQFNFKRQYPSILFPGKTQFVEEFNPKKDSLGEDAILDSINPFSWKKTADAVCDWEPDAAIISWWMPFFGPCMGYIAKRLEKEGIFVFSIVHNAIPHESHFFDEKLTKYFLNACTSNVALSHDVYTDLLYLADPQPEELFHPTYVQYGSKVDRHEAEQHLGLPEGDRNIMFFGLIRKYKGLDLLIEAFDLLQDERYHLIIAGEPYGSFDEYQALIDECTYKENIHLFTRYIPDDEVKYFFSAADVAVLPYRDATQSGIMAIAGAFEVPMVVTNVGSLRKYVDDSGAGYVCNSLDPQEIAYYINKIFDEDEEAKERFHENMKYFNDTHSWREFVIQFTEFIFKYQKARRDDLKREEEERLMEEQEQILEDEGFFDYDDQYKPPEEYDDDYDDEDDEDEDDDNSDYNPDDDPFYRL